MIKTFVFIEGGNNPFALSGQEAANEIRSIVPDIAGYIQTKALGESPFSGCGELYFRSSESADLVPLAALAALLPKSARIAASVSGMHRIVMRAPTFFEPKKIKGVYPFFRKPGMLVGDFQDYWWHTHGPIAALTEDALAYYQTHPMVSSYGSSNPDFDGVTEIYWPNMESAEAAVASRQMTEDQASDAQTFVDLDRLTLFFGLEEIIIAP